MTAPNEQFIRKASLLLTDGTKALDLSEMRFRFTVQNADVQSPNNCAVRVYNLSPQTVRQAKGEYSRVILQAGYERASFGVIFDGTIKQFKVGRENATDTFLDIFSADTDVGYNFGIVSKTFAAGSTPVEHIAEAARAMGLQVGFTPILEGVNPYSLPRGKVGFGMARDMMRKTADSLVATWSIQAGVLQMISLTGYLPGEAVVINSLSGMVGIPEQTEEGVKVRCLLNPKIRVGGLVRLNNKDITQLIQKDQSVPIRFDQWTGIQYAAKLADGADGLYRAYVAEHHGDTRGHEWYTDLICLAVKPSSGKVDAYG